MADLDAERCQGIGHRLPAICPRWYAKAMQPLALRRYPRKAGRKFAGWYILDDIRGGGSEEQEGGDADADANKKRLTPGRAQPLKGHEQTRTATVKTCLFSCSSIVPRQRQANNTPLFCPTDGRKGA